MSDINVRYRVKLRSILKYGLMGLLFIVGSCCPDDVHYWYPEGTFRYYDDHDTIFFKNSETDFKVKLVVCQRKKHLSLDEAYDRCNQKWYYHDLSYTLGWDSCSNQKSFGISVYSSHINDIGIFPRYTDSIKDRFVASFKDSEKSTIVILDKTYENTINIYGDQYDSMEYITFSHEFGILQFKFNDEIYSLDNIEE